jgi:hypothetical protein
MQNIYEDKDESFHLNTSSETKAYGKGIYFALNAAFINNELKALKTMLYCRVLVGMSQTANLKAGMKDTDFRDAINRIYYESVFDGNVFVIYKIRRAYPEYIIDF